MSLFGGRSKDGTKEFEEMRRALGSARDRDARGTDPVGRDPTDSIGAVSQEKESRPEENMVAVNATPSEPANQAAKAVPTPPEDCSSVVSAGSTWQGTLKSEGSVRVEGHLSGELEARETVHVSESAQVDAKVHASFVVIAGTFQGQVRCSERLELMPTSRITGELTTKSLVIHEGAFIDGQIHMSSDGQPAASSQAAQSKRPSSGSGKASEPANATGSTESREYPLPGG